MQALQNLDIHEYEVCYLRIEKLAFHELAVVIGIPLLLFRIWLDEIKLTDELQFRRRYFSRFFAYYSCLALAFGLSLYPLNIMVMVAFPILVVTSIWDVNFYRRFSSQTYWTKNRGWMLVERLTMHPPVVVLALFMILNGARNYIEPPNLLLMAGIIVVLYLPFFLFDERWTKRYKWPQAKLIVALFLASGISLLLAEAFLWGVPIW